MSKQLTISFPQEIPSTPDGGGLFLPEHAGTGTARINEFRSGIRRIRTESQAQNEWSKEQWDRFDAFLRRKALLAESDAKAWKILVSGARKVLRSYSTSFFIVTRFLPVSKRRQVEAIYAAVRYPDEIVDTFDITPAEKIARIDQWATEYELALQGGTLHELLGKGIPSVLVAFSRVVDEAKIPHHYYRSFLDAMRLDARSVLYESLDDLTDSYIYGSAIVVGYFLAYVYGPEKPGDFERALNASKDLGIALQLTNFMRDVGEDKQRERIYLPLDLLRKAEVQPSDVYDESSRRKLKPIINEILDIAEDCYSKAQSEIDVFSKDCRPAIQACIDVYRQLNTQIRNDGTFAMARHSVPLSKRLSVLPASKYWRLPASYILGL